MLNPLKMFSKKPDATFTDYLTDGTPVSTVDQRIAYVLGGGANISRRQAMQVSAVARGIHALTILGALKLQTYDKSKNDAANSLIDQIDPETTNVNTMTRTIEDLVFDGTAFWYVTERHSRGYPLSARYIPYSDIRVQPTLLSDGSKSYEYFYNGYELSRRDIIRFDSPRDPLLNLISQTVRQSLALQSTMESFAKAPAPKIIFTPKADTDADPAKIKSALTTFKDDRSSNPFAYVGAGLDATVVQLLSPADLQLIESDKAAGIAIANFFDMDADQINQATGESNTYNNAIDRRLDRRTNQLLWVATAIEQRLSMPDITPRGYYVEFDFTDFLRIDPKTQAEIAQIEATMGATTVTEYRKATGRAPLTMEQLQEIAMTKQMALPQNPAPIKVQASLGTDATFSDEETISLEFDTEASFARNVNENSRTVTVLAVPYGKLATSKGRKYEFAAGSLSYEDITRVKLLRDHDATQSVGHAIDAQETVKGLIVTFKIPNGPKGDMALAEFANKTHDGVSVGVDFNEVVAHPNHPGGLLVKSGKLKEVSQVALPAFDDSRVLAVQFARETDTINEGEIQMSDETKPETPDVTKLVADAVTAAFAARDKETSILDTAPVLDVKETAVASVTKEPLYRFDGSKGRFSFSQDLYDMRKGDEKAGERVSEYMSGDFAVAVTNVTALNPTIQTGGYVDQRDYEYPIWNAIKKGNVPNHMQPFAWAQYNASATLMSAHTEGQEPSLGSASVVGVTVTPAMSSGKIEVNREVWEMRGTPAVDQLLNGLFVRAYNESLEAAAVTFLEGLTLTEVTLTTNAVDDVLVDNLTGALIDLLTVRGGNTMTDLFINGTLYKLLAQAKDGDKRYLLPAVGPANAVGTTTNRFRGLDVNGIVGQPAWALPTSASASKNSYLLDRNAVSGWASPLTIENFDVQVKSVYIGAWGESAFALVDIAGVRRLKYDPTT